MECGNIPILDDEITEEEDEIFEVILDLPATLSEKPSLATATVAVLDNEGIRKRIRT